MGHSYILSWFKDHYVPYYRYGAQLHLVHMVDSKNGSKSRAIAITNKYTKYKTINDHHHLHHDTHANHLVQHHYAN